MAIVILNSCKKENITNSNNDDNSQQHSTYSTAMVAYKTNDEEEVTLSVGEQMVNPYTVSNMQNAADRLGLGRIISKNHYYIRFLPKTSEEIVTLVDNREIRVFEFPLERKLTGNACGYHDPTLPDNQVTWLYASIPVTQPYPTNIHHAILADLYIPTDEEYVLEATALEIAGYKELAEEMRANAVGKKEGAMATTAYKPKGTIKLYNNTLQKEEGLRNVKITLTTFFKWNDVWTDENGNFTATKNFLVPVDMWITFENSRASVRTQSGSVFPYYRHLGNGKTMYETIWDNWGVYWKVATVHNSAEEFNEWNANENVMGPPANLRIWIRNENGSTVNLTGAAPMLSKGNFGIVFNQWWNWFMAGAPSFYVNLVLVAFRAYTPDVIILLDKDQVIGSLEISETMYHELAHASHFSKVGSQFWGIYVNEIINNSFRDFENPYAGCQSANGGLISISEAWAFYRGYWFSWLKYNSVNALGNFYWDALETWTTSPAQGAEGCIRHPFFWDIFDDANWEPNNGITDKVNGGSWVSPNFTNQKMFDCMENTTRSPQQYRDLFIQRYGQSQASQINQLFQTYGY